MKISFQDLVDHINAKRGKQLQGFQELALMLADKLNDKKSIALYMKIAKNEEQELVMRALSYTLASLTGGENKGRFFMWKLKDLKQAEIESPAICLLLDKRQVPLLSMNITNRGDYVYAQVACQYLLEKYGENLQVQVAQFGNKWFIKDPIIFRLVNSVKAFFAEIEENYEAKAQNKGFELSEAQIITESDKYFVSGELKVADPVLTTRS